MRFPRLRVRSAQRNGIRLSGKATLDTRRGQEGRSPRRVIVLRSYLYVPGDRPDLMDKATQGDAHALILDLEDGVAPEARTAARREVAAFLARCRDGSGHPALAVRVHPDSLREDAAVAVTGGATTVYLPKADLAAVQRFSDAPGRALRRHRRPGRRRPADRGAGGVGDRGARRTRGRGVAVGGGTRARRVGPARGPGLRARPRRGRTAPVAHGDGRGQRGRRAAEGPPRRPRPTTGTSTGSATRVAPFDGWATRPVRPCTRRRSRSSTTSSHRPPTRSLAHARWSTSSTPRSPLDAASSSERTAR